MLEAGARSPGGAANLAGSLHARFRWTGAEADLESAVGTGRAAVTAMPAEHPQRAMFLSNLSNFLRSRFVRTGAGSDLDEAIGAGRAAVAATRFARTGVETDLDEAIGFGRSAIAGTPAGHPERAAMLSNLAGDRADLAAASLEQGRGVLWNQLLDTRSDLTALRRAAPDLAARLLAARAALERSTADSRIIEGELMLA